MDYSPIISRALSGHHLNFSEAHRSNRHQNSRNARITPDVFSKRFISQESMTSTRRLKMFAGKEDHKTKKGLVVKLKLYDVFCSLNHITYTKT
jgi:hypothetical protein